MFERLRFARYALRFERAYKTDVWGPVEACFAPDAVYTHDSGGAGFESSTRGRAEIVAYFKQVLDAVDRKYDRRIGRPRGWWRKQDGVLVVPWRARYVLGTSDVTLDGTSRCRFAGRLIAELSDTTNASEKRRWGELVGAS